MLIKVVLVGEDTSVTYMYIIFLCICIINTTLRKRRMIINVQIIRFYSCFFGQLVIHSIIVNFCYKIEVGHKRMKNK